MARSRPPSPRSASFCCALAGSAKNSSAADAPAEGPAPAPPTPAGSPDGPADDEASYEPPKVHGSDVIATRRDCRAFGKMLVARAWSLGIFHASSVFGTYLAVAAGTFIIGNEDLHPLLHDAGRWFGITDPAVLLASLARVRRQGYATVVEENIPGILSVGAPITGSIPLELGWSIIPFFISMAIFGWATVVFFHLVRAPDQTLEVYSTGKRWMWRFQHIDGQSEINQLHVPRGRPVKVMFTSEDVLHSLSIPAFRVKADAIPGRYSSIWFTPTKTGELHLFCAEYCGTKHSGMVGSVVVMEPDDYQAWLSGGGGGLSMSARGEQLFQQLGCSGCHLSDGSGRGPALAGKYGAQETLASGARVVVDDTYLRESILTPQARLVARYGPVMPTFQGQVNEEGLMSVIEYIKSLPSTGQPAAQATTAAPAAAAGPR